MRYIFLLIFISLTITVHAQTDLSVASILKKSIDFHDPNGKLSKGSYTFHFEESRPDGSVRRSDVMLAPSKEEFDIISYKKNHVIKYELRGKTVNVLLDNKSDITEEEISKFKINKERSLMIKNYYLYLWHLPMKLNDPGTIIDNNYTSESFNGFSCYKIKVTYEESVGHDIWYFYFDTTTFELRGYRFYHDEEKNDGEYIFLDGLTNYNEIKIPSKRDWYTHKEDKFLGSDKLVSISK